MAHRSDDVEVVRSVGSPLEDEDTSEKIFLPTADEGQGGVGGDGIDYSVGNGEKNLPQCKIKRRYSCSLCPFYSQNPRSFLYHSRDVHFDKIKIFECPYCLYASKHSQKLQRHVSMIHITGKNEIKKGNKRTMGKRKSLRPIKPKPTEAKSKPALASDEVKNEQALVPENSSNLETENCDENIKVGEKDSSCSLCKFLQENPNKCEEIVDLKKNFFQCHKCSYVTPLKTRYSKHLKYHSMPMIKCNVCDFRTPYKFNLERHLKNHNRTGGYQCCKCNFRADIKQSLTVHEMNHHIPPVGKGAIMAKKKKLFPSSSEITIYDSDDIETELIDVETEEQEVEIILEKSSKEEENDGVEGHEENKDKGKEDKEEKIKEVDSNLEGARNVKLLNENKQESINNNHLQTDFINSDDIAPRYGQIFVKSLKCKFCNYKAVFSHEISRHEKRIHGYIFPEQRKKNSYKRPPPSLIPIQNKVGANIPTSSSSDLTVPFVRKKAAIPSPETSPVEESVNEKEFNEMCRKSSLTSSLKDIVSLIGDEEGLKTIPDSSLEDPKSQNSTREPEIQAEDCSKEAQTDTLKKKNSSFFDRLKEKLLTGSDEEQSLSCEVCGHDSKCLSEAVAHQKRHSCSSHKIDAEDQSEVEIIFSGTESSSTRCQHCRLRCKTSSDLVNHLKSCKAISAAQNSEPPRDSEALIDFEEPLEEDKTKEDGNSPMENRVFVWNNLYLAHEGEEEEMDLNEFSNEDIPAKVNLRDGSIDKDSEDIQSEVPCTKTDSGVNLSVKEVYKCPQCSFWATTASRFHVHIVGHLNKKPFECSFCQYRSNWRWDITKHIRLKSARDASHQDAKVNMTDETGRRNYSKYNKYLTVMKVQEATALSSGSGKRSKFGDFAQESATQTETSLPAPPKLTRAPAPAMPHEISQGVFLRPPPPLKAAHQTSPTKEIIQFDQAKPCVGSPKKTVWKCKKCNFKNSIKDIILAHVKMSCPAKKYANALEGNASGAVKPPDDDTVLPPNPSPKPNLKRQFKGPRYKCDHCHQVSKWKNVIQRHCRLKHKDAVVEINQSDESFPDKTENVEKPQNSKGLILCDICPFTADTEEDLKSHKLNHVDRRGFIFKCSYCPFYVPSKKAIHEHLEIHGNDDKFNPTSSKVDNCDPSENNRDLSSENLKTTKEYSKKYKCSKCPYQCNSRVQFLYHMQFHKPKNAAYKCLYCSYNVCRRNQLHQHLRVHHKKRHITKLIKKSTDSSAKEEAEEKTRDLTQVWVFRSGNFHKMFKCRWCPFVNVKRFYVLSHEKMHRSDEMADTIPESGFPLPRFHCPDCSYTCLNPSVLKCHIKIHRGFHGEIRCQVDPNRTVKDQLRELRNSIEVSEPETEVSELESEVANLGHQRKVDVEAKPDGGLTSGEKVASEQLPLQPENTFDEKPDLENGDESNKVLSFCSKCPARFLCQKQFSIHSKFHKNCFPFRCLYCTYSAKKKPHLLSHHKVHGQEYQEKTAGLIQTYPQSKNCPQPSTIISTKKSNILKGPVWTVIEDSSSDQASKPISTALPELACGRCPAKFFKPFALQYHLTLHGSSHENKCKYCDYAVKTYGNLVQHQFLHEIEKVPCKKTLSYSISLFKNNNGEDTEKEKKTQEIDDHPLKVTSCLFASVMTTTNTKIKEKKFKCSKCPSAFEKRQQYDLHLSHHGSNQKYVCDKCDYSVKYFSNYSQHRKKHESEETPGEEDTESNVSISERKPQETERKSENCTESKEQYELVFLENQGLVLKGEKEEKKAFCCNYCPYISSHKVGIEVHSPLHFRVSGIKLKYKCSHCDYSTVREWFLRDHVKLHFYGAFPYKANAYFKCENLELWYFEEKAEVSTKTLLFQDKGKGEENRFLPPCEGFDLEENVNFPKMYFDPETGQVSGNAEAELSTKELTVGKAEEELEGPSNEYENLKVENPTEKSKKEGNKERFGRIWPCEKCPHVFKKKSLLLKHVRLHGSNQKYTCHTCDYSVNFITNYLQHMRMHKFYEPGKLIRLRRYQHNEEETEMYNMKVLHRSSRPKGNTETNKSLPDQDLLVSGTTELLAIGNSLDSTTAEGEPEGERRPPPSHQELERHPDDGHPRPPAQHLEP